MESFVCPQLSCLQSPTAESVPFHRERMVFLQEASSISAKQAEILAFWTTNSFLSPVLPLWWARKPPTPLRSFAVRISPPAATEQLPASPFSRQLGKAFSSQVDNAAAAQQTRTPMPWHHPTAWLGKECSELPRCKALLFHGCYGKGWTWLQGLQYAQSNLTAIS